MAHTKQGLQGKAANDSLRHKRQPGIPWASNQVTGTAWALGQPQSCIPVLLAAENES